MRKLISYSCSTCGGALIVNRSEEVLNCPFCGNAFDLTLMHRKELLEDAAVNMQQREFNAAKAKFNSLLESDPHDFEALRGLALCAGKLQSVFSLKSPDKIKKPELDEMRTALEFAKANASADDASYFADLLSLADIVDERFKNAEDKTGNNENVKEEISNRSTPEIILNIIYFCSGLVSVSVLIYFFLVIQNPNPGIFTVLGIIAFCLILHAVDVLFIRRRVNEQRHRKIVQMNRETDVISSNMDELEKKYDGIFKSLIRREPSLTSSKIPKYIAKDSYKAGASVQGDSKVTCTKCAGSLIPDKDNNIYRCLSCGVAYGSSILFDSDAKTKAESSVLLGEFNEADVWYNCMLMVRSYDFDALRGRILCAARWKDFAGVECPTSVSVVRIKNIRDRIGEALVHAWDKDRGYFDTCKSFIDLYEELWNKELKMKPLTDKRDALRKTLQYQYLGMNAEMKTTDYYIARELDPLISERDEVKERFLKVRDELARIDAGSPANV
ncbi:MAG: hypothetical protein IKH20_00655 [Clostridiales bacterium]|nr:hypothetical protein [Clostridiales bacterium]